MHVGEKPYVVTTSETTDQFRGPLAWGEVELPSRVLTQEALSETLGRILSIDQRAALDAYGAIKFDVTSSSNPNQRFVVVAARGGDDVWLEIRRHPNTVAATTEGRSPDAEPDAGSRPEIQAVAGRSVPKTDFIPPEAATAVAMDAPLHETRSSTVVDAVPPDLAMTPSIEDKLTSGDHDFVTEHLLTMDSEWGDDVLTEGDLHELLRGSAGAIALEDKGSSQKLTRGHAKSPTTDAVKPTTAEKPSQRGVRPDEVVANTGTHEAPTRDSAGESSKSASAPDRNHGEEVTRSVPARVVPLMRQARSEPPADIRGGLGTLERILRLAVGRGAAAVYLVAQSRPMVRIDDEIVALDDEEVLGATFVERLTTAISPHSGEDSAAAAVEWTIDVPDVGRVRCMNFRDYRGPGLIVRMAAQRAISVDQLALPPEVQALCSEGDGLVLMAGGRGNGKSTLLTSLVDLINRTRSDHVITLESRIDFVHENKRSFISQREIRGDGQALASAARAAAREDPDILVIDDLRNAEMMTVALETAQAGRLVLASMQAASAVSTVERIIEMFPAERRADLRVLLAGTLRGIVVQVLLRKIRGGLVVAREVLLNVPTVADLILEGKAFQLPAALENGRSVGMISLAESLATLVREGKVHPAHAYRKAPNREQFLAILRRDGVETSIAERFA